MLLLQTVPVTAQKLVTLESKDLKVTLWNRAVDQPYTQIGTWMVDEWRKVGIKSDQRVVPTTLWYAVS